MPTVLEVDGFKFYFFSAEGNEPVHIHVKKAGNECKYWLEPVSISKNYGFNSKELKKIEVIIYEYQNYLIGEYNEFFKH